MGDYLLITGAEGYVGRRLVDQLGVDNEVVGLSRTGIAGVACDLLDTEAVVDLANELNPRAIVHAAGIKDLKACERTPPAAYEGNVATLINLLRAWPDVPLLYISTDYVFPGDEGRYTETDATAPSTVYGLSKLCAENTGRLLAPATFTSVRVSAVYDQDATFLTFLSKELTAGRPVECFFDAFYSPTYIGDLTAAIAKLLVLPERPQIVHIAGPRISRYDFARQYAQAFGFDLALIRPAERAEGSTLFPDLSLETATASARCQFTPTAHQDALAHMASGGNRDHSRPFSPVLRFPGPDARSHQRRAVGGDQLHLDRRGVPARRALSPRHA